MGMYDTDFWMRFSPILFLIFLGMIVAWATWPEEKARMNKRREIREHREQKEKDGVTDLALVTMPLWMDNDSSDSSSLSSSDYESSSSSYSDFD
ncbi:MAG: hypothetical protein L3J59_13445 [Methylococcaceae bacterium]|nr:hypothetical protein [Methylococcaceae bacterium]